MLAHGLARLRRFARRCVATVRARVSAWTAPRPRSLATGLATDLVRLCGAGTSSSAILAESSRLRSSAPASWNAIAPSLPAMITTAVAGKAAGW